MSIVDFKQGDDLAAHAAKFQLATDKSIPDGNLHIDFTTGEISIYNDEEIAEIRPGISNPIIAGNDGGVTVAALLYYFQFLHKNSNEHRRYSEQADINFMDVNAYVFLNGYHINSAHIARIKSSGLELKSGDLASSTDKYYIGVSTGGLDAAHTAYRRFGNGVPENEVTGNFNNLVEVPADARINSLDLAYFLREFGYEPQTFRLSEINLPRAGGYTAPINIASVRYGRWNMGWVTDIAAGQGDWTGIKMRKLDTVRTVSGMGGDGTTSGTFSVVVENPDGISLDKITAWLMYHQNQDDNFIIDSSDVLIGGLEGRRINMLFDLDGDNVKFRQLEIGGDQFGIFVENLGTTDQTRITQISDDGTALIYPYLTEVRINFFGGVDITSLSQTEKDMFWFSLYLKDSYNSETAALMNNIDNNPVTGVFTDLVNGVYSFFLSYDFDTSGGQSAATDKEVVLRAGGLAVKQNATKFVITRQSLINVSVKLELLQS